MYRKYVWGWESIHNIKDTKRLIEYLVITYVRLKCFVIADSSYSTPVSFILTHIHITARFLTNANLETSVSLHLNTSAT